MLTSEECSTAKTCLTSIAPYPEHLSNCTHWASQTLEYCTCGYDDAYQAFLTLYTLLLKGIEKQ